MALLLRVVCRACLHECMLVFVSDACVFALGPRVCMRSCMQIKWGACVHASSKHQDMVIRARM